MKSNDAYKVVNISCSQQIDIPLDSPFQTNPHTATSSFLCNILNKVFPHQNLLA
jgi:hypothetical protein